MSRPKSSLVWLLAIGALGSAQTQPPRADEKPASLEGEVRNAVSGMPVERAHVSIRRFTNGGNEKYGALTNAEGKFSINGIPAGSYQVMLDRVGYVAPLESTRNQLMLKPGDKRDNFKIKLIPTGSISGRALDADGKPMEGLQVQAEQAGRTQRSAVTDDRGQFRIGGLSPGKYRIKAIPPEMPLPPEIRTDGTAEVHYAATYHPGAVTAKDGTRVMVGAATDVISIDIHMARTRIVRIAGKVAGIPEGAKNVFIQLRGADGSQTSTGGPVKPDGSFEIWRPNPGKYTLSATIYNSGEMLSSGPATIEVSDSDVENIGLTMISPEEIRGQLNFDDEDARQPPQLPSGMPPMGGAQPMSSAPAAGQGGQTSPPRIPRRIILREVFGNGQVKMADVAEDGSFTLSKVAPANYMVTTQGYGGFVKGSRLGEVAKDGVLLDLTRGSAGAPLTITLSSAYAEISGTVLDDKGPAAGARIVLADTVGIGSIRGTAVSQADGTFTVKSVPPGAYKLMAIDEGETHTMVAEPNMDDYDERAENVEVHPKDKLTRDLRVRPRAEPRP